VAEFFLYISLRWRPALGLYAIPRHTGLRNIHLRNQPNPLEYRVNSRRVSMDRKLGVEKALVFVAHAAAKGCRNAGNECADQ
jgi:hypothetical protein